LMSTDAIEKPFELGKRSLIGQSCISFQQAGKL